MNTPTSHPEYWRTPVARDIAQVFLRLAMAWTFLSAVASRFGLSGSESSGWSGFLSYTAETLSFLPASLIPFCAVASTLAETSLSVLLIVGYKTRWAAFGAAFLTLMFAISMAVSFGLKSPLDYSVFVDCAACFLLGTADEFRWSVDDGWNEE